MTKLSRSPFRFLAALFFLACFALASFPAEARVGGGRSSGFRGSRGFAPRTSQSQSGSFQTRPQGGYGSTATGTSPGYANPAASGMGGLGGGGGMLRGLMTGIAGGFVGSMLFRSLGFAGTGLPGGGGFGILEMLLLAGLVFLVFRLIAARRSPAFGADSFMASDSSFRRSSVPAPEQAGGEGEAVQVLRRYDPSFELSRFKDERVDDFVRMQNAWSSGDLSRVEPILAPELSESLQADLAGLKSQGRVNRLGSIALRGSELTEAWQEYGKEYATVRFRASLTDTVLDARTGAVLEGDPTEQVKFDECWTFSRSVDGPAGENPWKLTAIQQ